MSNQMPDPLDLLSSVSSHIFLDITQEYNVQLVLVYQVMETGLGCFVVTRREEPLQAH